MSKTPGDVRRAIDRLPRMRIANLPTPLKRAPRLTAALGGPTILVKHEDATGLALGGNKIRMFDFILGKAKAEGATAVIGGAAVQSNYSRQLAAACALLGLECHLVLRKTRGTADEEVQGNLLLDLIFGANVTVAESREEQAVLLRELVRRLEKAGSRVYQARNASDADNAVHAAAYVEAALELNGQLRDLGVSATHQFVSTLDTTHAGLLLGWKALGWTGRIEAISPFERSLWDGRSIEEEVVRIALETEALLQLEVDLSPRDVNVSTAFADKYGAVTPAALEAIRLFGTTEGILLDPVYTAKAAAGMISAIREGALTKDHTVVFWHTGGQPALFAYASELGFAMPQNAPRSLVAD